MASCQWVPHRRRASLLGAGPTRPEAAIALLSACAGCRADIRASEYGPSGFNLSDFAKRLGTVLTLWISGYPSQAERNERVHVRNRYSRHTTGPAASAVVCRGLRGSGAEAENPYPIVLVVAGLLLECVPGLPRITFDPELILFVVLPPLLYGAAWSMSWQDFSHNLVGIASLAVGRVAFTVFGVAEVAPWFFPASIGAWASFWVLSLPPQTPLPQLRSRRALDCPSTNIRMKMFPRPVQSTAKTWHAKMREGHTYSTERIRTPTSSRWFRRSRGSS